MSCDNDGTELHGAGARKAGSDAAMQNGTIAGGELK